MKLLLVEDEKRMAQALVEILRLEKYDVDLCTDGITAMNTIETNIYDLIVLDVMLPGKSGFEIARQTRSDGIKTPILMLTAKGELDDKVTGLDSGADDYLTKPFMTKELLARLRALSRRNINTPDGTLSFGDISLDTNTSTLYCKANGQSVRLREKEYQVIEYLIANQEQILSREQLALKIWGYDNEAEYNNVEVYLSFTRKKLAFIGSNVEIKAVRGIGYELRYKNV
jgi:DNA-binding response OmpR family regulator